MPQDVTVVVPTYNRAPLLARTVRSLVDQTEPCRVIVVDDASSDETPRVCAQFDSVEYHRNRRRLGLFANWNAAVALVSTPFVAIFHDEDLYNDQIVAKEVSLLRRHDAVMFVHSGCHFIDDHDRRTYTHVANWPSITTGAAFRRAIAGQFHSPVAAPSAMVRTDALRAVGGFDERLRVSGDTVAWFALAELGDVGYVHEPLVSLRRPGTYANEHAEFDWSIIDEHIEVAKQTEQALRNRVSVSFRVRADWYLTKLLSREIARGLPAPAELEAVVNKQGSPAVRWLVRVAPRLSVLAPVLRSIAPLARRWLESVSFLADRLRSSFARRRR